MIDRKLSSIGFRVFFLLLLCHQINSFSQIIDDLKSPFFYQFSSTYKFKQAIVSLTFDDGRENQFKNALPLLHKMNLPATFYLITNEIDSTIPAYFTNKDEVGSHTVDHSDLKALDSQSLQYELKKSHEDLINSFGKDAGLTIAYPWGSYNNAVISVTEQYYIAARTANIGYNSIVLYDKYALNVQSFDEKSSLKGVNSWIDHSINNRLWLIEMYHNISEDMLSPKTGNFMRHLSYISDNADKIWCSTVSDVIKYSEEYKHAKVFCDFCNDTVYKIRIDDSLDDAFFNHPLSIKIKVPDSWEDISFSDSTAFRIENSGKKQFVLFDVVPDNHQISIKPQKTKPVIKEPGITLISQTSNPFFDNFDLSLQIVGSVEIEIRLFDIYGKTLFIEKKIENEGINTIRVNGSDLQDGMYILRVKSSSGQDIIKKIIKD
ncbi:MAG TPA: polysaccharide deacetylase family protein [Bacteroidales bacterium]|nr:polysaccharide deacetylase family protein [Bacteroidales bacterium]